MDNGASGMQVRTMTLMGVFVRVSSYQVGTSFSCRIDNVDPGANIARAMAKTRGEAEERATAGALLSLQMRSATAALRAATEKLAR